MLTRLSGAVFSMTTVALSVFLGPTIARSEETLRYAVMTFYVAKGAPDACGKGCSEWIAAEGDIGLGSAARLAAILKRTQNRKLPVFFDSLGGLLGEALKMGRMLRERGISAGVAWTIAEACNGKSVQECRDLKKSDKALQAELKVWKAGCSSACVYALAGAKERKIWPGVRLGVHASTPILIHKKTGQIRKVAAASGKKGKKSERPKRDEQIETFVREMGIDRRLIDTANAVSHDKIHYLTRDQIAAFGLDRSAFLETPWSSEAPFAAPTIQKYFVRAKGREQREFPTSLIRFSCSKSNDRLAIYYWRGLAEADHAQWDVTLTIGAAPVPFRQTSGLYEQNWIENKRTFDIRVAAAGFDVVGIPPDGTLTITEKPAGQPAAAPQVIELSSSGWKEAIEKLREKCVGRGSL